MASAGPLVTVLMPVYNGKRYLSQAIKSILNQTFNEFEFIIIDDESTDNSIEIIKSYDDPRIKLIKNDYNLGQTTTLNKGIELSKGKYIARLDQDDISKSNRLSLQVEFFFNNRCIVLLGSNSEYIDSNNKIIGSWETCTDHYEIINSFHKHNPFAHSSVMFNKEKVMKLGCYSKEYVYAQDLALWVKICSQYKVANLNQFITKIRIHDQQATFDKKLKKIKYIEESKIIHDILRIPGLTKRSIIDLKIKLLYMKMFNFNKQINNKINLTRKNKKNVRENIIS